MRKVARIFMVGLLGLAAALGTSSAATSIDHEEPQMTINTEQARPGLTQPNGETEMEKRGCCSHHGGVCGCNSSGRVECCDGTLSPTCTC